VRYRVRKGDTLGGIADQFSVSPEELRKWNGLKARGLAGAWFFAYIPSAEARKQCWYTASGDEKEEFQRQHGFSGDAC